jgi:MFS family permease
VLILKQAGMSATHAARGDFAVKLLNCCTTIVAIALVDRRGRKFLLLIGTGGIIVSLSAAALFFHRFEAQRVDVRAQLSAAIVGGRLTYPIHTLEARDGMEHVRTHVLTVLYSYGDGDRITAILSSDRTNALIIEPPPAVSSPLVIKRATYGPVPSEKTGWIITACIAAFIGFFSVGPGVVVWLALSELMPTRIRAAGMGIALFLNQGVSALIAGLFLPVVGRYGYYAMFLFWTACTVIYFFVVLFLLPETRGKTLEEIEQFF